MQKILAILAVSLMLAASAGCGSKAPGTPSQPSPSAAENSSAVAPGVSGASSGAASGAGQQTSSAPQKTVVVPKNPYRAVTTTYKFNQGQKYFHVEYPQLSGSGNYAAVNSLLKQTAMKTADSIGTGNTSSYARVETSDHVFSSSADFISVWFDERVKASKTADETRTVRAVNYDLKNSKALSADDLVQKNAALTSAVQNAVKKQMSAKKQQLYTASVLSNGIKNCSIYFKSDSLGISLPVSAALGGHVEFKIDYKDTAGLRTGNAVWGYFVK